MTRSPFPSYIYQYSHINIFFMVISENWIRIHSCNIRRNRFRLGLYSLLGFTSIESVILNRSQNKPITGYSRDSRRNPSTVASSSTSNSRHFFPSYVTYLILFKSFGLMETSATFVVILIDFGIRLAALNSCLASSILIGWHVPLVDIYIVDSAYG